MSETTELGCTERPGAAVLTGEHRELALSLRKKIFAFQDALKNEIDEGRMTAFDFDANLSHQFAPGVYMRTLKFPAGTYIVGKIHKHAHPNILSKGEVLVLTEGGGLERLVGPVEMISPPGTKRALYALQDTTWTTIHLTDVTDLEKIEEHVIAKTYEEYEQFRLAQEAKPAQIEGAKP
jgi:hypothetical protein